MKRNQDKIKNPIGVSLESLSPNHPFAGATPGQQHPTPEQLLVREAAKYLTPRQKRVWALYNYDKLTQDEIGAELGISHQGVAKHIKAIEARIKKWVKGNMAAYNLIKAEMER
jgi:DNA-directed RNA polymerase specialized sigma24 family protein